MSLVSFNRIAFPYGFGTLNDLRLNFFPDAPVMRPQPAGGECGQGSEHTNLTGQ